MCGITAYVGERDAAAFLLQGLGNLEYRGYDSAGLCCLTNKPDASSERKLTVAKTAGRIADLREKLNGTAISGTIGIGHTRWATHGAPTDNNAHPHVDCTGAFAVVHNGIIENHAALRGELEGRGHRFESETDTEVIVHLLEEYYQGDLVAAVSTTVSRLQGSFAIAAMTQHSPHEVVICRWDSPLVIGFGDGENYAASDVPAILEHTRRVCFLEDGEIARVTAAGVACFDRELKPLEKEITTIDWDPIRAKKGGFADFMLKEIHEQPRAVRDTLAAHRGALGRSEGQTLLPDSVCQGVRRVQLVACGTAFHAALFGQYVLEELLDIPVEAALGSEYRYKRMRADASTLVIAVSQSGETADTLGAIREAKKAGARTVAVTNVVGSTIAREVNAVVYTHAGPEIAVASTKAYTTMLVCLCLTAAALRGALYSESWDSSALAQGVASIPGHMENILTDWEPWLANYAEKLRYTDDVFFVGRGLDYLSAMEGQLKLKEISYIHSEALAAGELKHGTLALVVPGVHIVALATQRGLWTKTMSNLREIGARGGEILLITVEGYGNCSEISQEPLFVPRTEALLSPMLTALPMQLLAYYTAKARGCDIDKPRNLAKSVTVE